MNDIKHLNSIDAVKEAILRNGGLIISRGETKNDFTYMLKDGFGYVELDSLSYEVKLSSLYEGSKTMGSGSEYMNHGPYSEIELMSATKAVIGNGTVNWFQSLEDYLIQSYFLFQYTVESAESTKPAIDYIDDVYVYISEKHGTYVNKRRIGMDRFLKRNDKFQTLFHLKDGKMTIVETNVSDEAIENLNKTTNVQKILEYRTLSGFAKMKA